MMRFLAILLLTLPLESVLACKCDDQTLLQRELTAKTIFVGTFVSIVQDQSAPHLPVVHSQSSRPKALILVNESFRGKLMAGEQVLIDHLAGTTCEPEYLVNGRSLFVIDESKNLMLVSKCDVYPLTQPKSESELMEEFWSRKLQEANEFLRLLRERGSDGS